MEIVVLLKQVPTTESLVEVADDGKSIKTEDINWVINPYDEFAVEEALQIREEQGGSVTILSLGPARAAEAIRTALAMGADKGVLIDDPALTHGDSLATAQVLAAAVKEMPCDLILAGQRGVDGDNFQVGTMVAELLGVPNISLVVNAEITEGRIRCQRTVEGGTVVVEADLPALITTQRGLNEPRYASLPGIMKAKRKPIDTKDLAALGLDPGDFATPAVEILALEAPPAREGGKVIEGATAQDKAAELARLLAEEAKVL